MNGCEEALARPGGRTVVEENSRLEVGRDQADLAKGSFIMDELMRTDG